MLKKKYYLYQIIWISKYWDQFIGINYLEVNSVQEALRLTYFNKFNRIWNLANHMKNKPKNTKMLKYLYLLIFLNTLEKYIWIIMNTNRDVTTGATGATVVAPKFSDTLTLSQPRWAYSAYHRRGRS